MTRSTNDIASIDLLKAAQLTVVFTSLYSMTFCYVLVTKKRLLKQAKSGLTKPFNRYASPQMQTADRLNANFLEWSPIFLGLVWSLASTENLTNSHSVNISWCYLGLRGLYIVLILQNGIAADGMNKALWISTFPAYGCLVYLASQAVRFLFF